MINKDMKLIPKAQYGATYADVQNAVYKEIDEMPANVMANGFGINGYDYDYAAYLRQNPIMLYKFRNLLKYGMGVLPVIYGYKNK